MKLFPDVRFWKIYCFTFHIYIYNLPVIDHFFSVKREISKTFWASLVTQLVKNLPEMQDTWVRSVGWENPLEKGKATHSSILAWRIPRTV